MRTSIVVILAAVSFGCDKPAPIDGAGTAAAQPAALTTTVEQAAPHPPVDPTNIVSIAGGSKDHTTLVAALKAADYIDSVSNAGPLTVFAPTNAAFEKLPAGTLDGLLKPDQQAALKEVLKNHVTVSTYGIKDLHDGQILSMANNGKVTVHVKDGKVSVNDANIVASIPASNGIVHVIDAVLLPSPAK